ncbi:MAG: GNAT family N-acetyltransferase [Brevefilum sp.]
MVATTLPAYPSYDPIRQFDLRRDLEPVADLIERCFPIHADPDGQTYVAEMRKAAREMRLMGWLAGFSDQYPMRSSGFVWEEDGQLIGNLSLIPLQKDGRQVHLIANVAVHPAYRRRGIARKLTQKALTHLARGYEREVWLQVRADNPAAIALYRSMGFTDQAARTTWRIRPKDLNVQVGNAYPQARVRRWGQRDWAAQQAWLEAAYPASVRWHLPLNYRRFSPGALQLVANYMEGEVLKHWSVVVDGTCRGVITWQKSNSYAHHLWLAFPEDDEAEVLPAGLAQVLRRLPKKHPLSIDYPAGRCSQELAALGFEPFRTLIWMVHRF